MIARFISPDYSPLSVNRGALAFVGVEVSRTPALKLNEHYLVVAMLLGPFTVWLYVDDRFSGLRYPALHPAALFEITDPTVSATWQLGSEAYGNSQGEAICAPSEWLGIRNFSADLFEGESSAQRTYEGMLSQLRMERPLPWVSESAKAVGTGNWVTDQEWVEQWEADPGLGMTRHPKRGTLMHNPLFGGRVPGE